MGRCDPNVMVQIVLLLRNPIFFSALHKKYCISVEKYIISIIKCSLLLRSGLLYKLSGVFHDSGKAAVSGFAGLSLLAVGLVWNGL